MRVNEERERKRRRKGERERERMRGEEKRSSSKRCVRVRKSAYDGVLYVRSPPADAYVADAYVRVYVCNISRVYTQGVSSLKRRHILEDFDGVERPEASESM